ncbi:MAG: prepilin-type N-terminal cleavage/methylation domain-containing protein [Gammaproteobacteria bacterium]
MILSCKHKINQQGFSLLEVLVAFSILALSLSVLFQIYSRGTQSTALSRDYNQAIIIAQSKMAELDQEKKIVFGEKSGSTDEQVQWQRIVSEYQDPDPDFFNRNYQLVNVEVIVRWTTMGRDYDFSLNSRRIAGMK